LRAEASSGEEDESTSEPGEDAEHLDDSVAERRAAGLPAVTDEPRAHVTYSSPVNAGTPPYPPIEPPPARVTFPDPRRAGRREIIAVGEDFTPSTLLAAYRQGIFPWPQSRKIVPWCSPDPRAIFPLGGSDEAPHWSRSLRRTLRLHPYEITVDAAFGEVMRSCGEERRGGTWITPEMLAGYAQLHALGWAHSLEVWERDDAGGRRTLVGGIYGVAIGALFAGESMFHRRTDASKIAFANLVTRLREGGFTVFDVQVMNDHLLSLGCIEIRRAHYLDMVAEAIVRPARLPP
jgi:leucyl/phenylalanyl-tRNA---protein transferase